MTNQRDKHSYSFIEIWDMRYKFICIPLNEIYEQITSRRFGTIYYCPITGYKQSKATTGWWVPISHKALVLMRAPYRTWLFKCPPGVGAGYSLEEATFGYHFPLRLNVVRYFRYEKFKENPIFYLSSKASQRDIANDELSNVKSVLEIKQQHLWNTGKTSPCKRSCKWNCFYVLHYSQVQCV